MEQELVKNAQKQGRVKGNSVNKKEIKKIITDK